MTPTYRGATRMLLQQLASDWSAIVAELLRLPTAESEAIIYIGLPSEIPGERADLEEWAAAAQAVAGKLGPLVGLDADEIAVAVELTPQQSDAWDEFLRRF